MVRCTIEATLALLLCARALPAPDPAWDFAQSFNHWVNLRLNARASGDFVYNIQEVRAWADTRRAWHTLDHNVHY